MRLIEQSYEILNISGSLELIEQAGRVCYKSEEKMGEGTAERFVGKIVHRLHHESVIEHSSMTVKFITSRGVSHELVRHRLASFSQESTRYVNYTGRMEFIRPAWPIDSDADFLHFQMTLSNAENQYRALLKSGWTPEQAREVLPNALKTEIVMTANFREWRHVFNLRTAKNAHPNMRALMTPLLTEVQERIPVIFDDMKEVK